MADEFSMTVTPSIRSVNKKIDRVGDKITNLRNPLEKTGSELQQETRKNLRKRVDFNGRAIPALKQSTIARRRRRGINPNDHPLVESGDMMMSIRHKVTMGKNISKTVIGPRGRREQKKARFHWHGGGRRKKRQFMGLNKTNIRLTVGNFREYIQTEIKIVTR